MVALGFVAAMAPRAAEAAGLTVAWNRGPENDIATYEVAYGTSSGLYLGQVTVDASVTQARIENLVAGRRYYIVVRARNQAGLVSPNSAEVSGVAADASQPPAPGAVQTYFAEGASGFFDYRMALLNLSAAATTVNVTYLPQDGTPFTRTYPLPASARATIGSEDIPEVAGTSFGAVVAALPTVVAERTMRWQLNGADGAHTAKALPASATRWYLAEGNAGFFDTFVLLVNSGTTTASVTVDFLLDGGGLVRRVYSVPANQRYTIWANELSELTWRSFATTVTSSVPILVERAMYFRGAHGPWEGGHASAALTAGARSWFLAEGSTGTWFDTFVLISNPGTTTLTATIDYLTPSGLVRTEQRTLAPQSRTTIHVDTLPGLADTEVSCAVNATGDIIVERSMYWPGLSGWYGGHNSVGVTTLGTRWALAEGEVGGPDGADTFVLLANPGTVSSTATITFYRADGSSVQVSRTIPPGSRRTVSASSAGLTSGERFGTVVQATQPLAVERSIYWNHAGTTWTSGTNEVAIRLQ